MLTHRDRLTDEPDPRILSDERRVWAFAIGAFAALVVVLGAAALLLARG